MRRDDCAADEQPEAEPLRPIRLSVAPDEGVEELRNERRRDDPHIVDIDTQLVPRRAVDANSAVEICPLQDSWSVRAHLLCYSANAPDSAHQLASHLHAAASS